jgi:hypothetical protein
MRAASGIGGVHDFSATKALVNSKTHRGSARLAAPELPGILLLVRGSEQSVLQLLVVDGFRQVAIYPRLQSLIALLI